MYVTGLGSYYISVRVHMCYYTCMSRTSAVITYLYMCSCAIIHVCHGHRQLLYISVYAHMCYICHGPHQLLYIHLSVHVHLCYGICLSLASAVIMYTSVHVNMYRDIYFCHGPRQLLLCILSIHVQSGGNCDEVYSDTEGTQALCVCARLP